MAKQLLEWLDDQIARRHPEPWGTDYSEGYADACKEMRALLTADEPNALLREIVNESAEDPSASCSAYVSVQMTRSTWERLRRWGATEEDNAEDVHGLPHLDTCALKYGQHRCTCGLL
jgi:hypothetical protein